MSTLVLRSLEEYVAIDCEMVGSKSGQVLAKIGIVNHEGDILLESFVYVNPANVLDYRTSSSGIRRTDLERAPTFEMIKPRIEAILEGKIVVGHTLFNDLKAIDHRHPYEAVRDTALYYPLRKLVGVEREGEFPSLRNLALKVLRKEIQRDTRKGDDPIEDARATMAIFLAFREEYESSLINNEDVLSGLPASFERYYW